MRPTGIRIGIERREAQSRGTRQRRTNRVRSAGLWTCCAVWPMVRPSQWAMDAIFAGGDGLLLLHANKFIAPPARPVSVTIEIDDCSSIKPGTSRGAIGKETWKQQRFRIAWLPYLVAGDRIGSLRKQQLPRIFRRCPSSMPGGSTIQYQTENTRMFVTATRIRPTARYRGPGSRGPRSGLASERQCCPSGPASEARWR